MFTITYTDINRGTTWTSRNMEFASRDEAEAYARKVRKNHARAGANVRIDSVDAV